MSRVKVSDVAVINKANFNFKNVKFVNYLDTGSITNNNIEQYQLLRNDAKIPSRAKRAVSNGTIVYSSVRPRLCHFGFLQNIPENTVVSTGFITLDAKPNINAYYLYNCLITPDKIEYIAQIADTSVSSYPSINPEDLGNMEIDIVDDYDEQCRIASIMRTINDKIANNNAISSELEAMAKTIYDYWFLQFEFPNEEGKPYKSSGGKMVWSEELKREIPEGWEVSALGSHFNSERGLSYSTKNIETDKGIPMINLANFRPGGGAYKEDGLKHYLGEYPESKRIKPYDLVMCNTQQTAVCFSTDIIGRAMLVPDIFEGDIVSSHHVNVIRTGSEELKYYLLYLFNSDFFHKYISGYTNGTNILGLTFDGVTKYTTELPNSTLLHRFMLVATEVEKKKSVIIRENRELTSLRDFLLPMLMNGQIKVGE